MKKDAFRWIGSSNKIPSETGFKGTGDDNAENDNLTLFLIIR